MDGVLIVDKPAGWTSHDVVAKVKKKLGAKKAGHLGTLDPLATGVLVLVLDRATRSARLLDNGKKEYITVLKLGIETDTYDSEGKVVSSSDASHLKDDDILRAFEVFRGKINQVPPMYSSIKKGGVPLYKLARKGVTVEREARAVEIYGLEVTKIDIPFVGFRVLCSRGTYVRSICHDAGKALGCGAHMTELRRTRCGEFAVDRAISPLEPADALSERIIPLDAALRMASPDDCAKRALGAGAL